VNPDRRIFPAAMLLFCLPVALAGRALAEPHTYRDQLIERAGRLSLERDPRWLALGHWEKNTIGGGVKSSATGPHFWLAENGRTDPRAELEATIRAFFEPEAVVKDGEHPQCAFRGRYFWFVEKFDIDAARLPPVRCVRFERWMDGLDPAGLSLVFPEAYMNNPASMFGHTLLRVDPGAEGEAKDLLAYAVNFAAEAGGDGGAAFAVKGIFGGYDGVFSVLPYYEKLKQYGDWENRDIWEYRLNFDVDEVRLVLAHVWELRGIPFQYFFFDDNCSFQLFALLETVKPELRLTPKFPLWVIPGDTVRVAAEQEGLISDIAYRASPATRIRFEAGRLSPGDQKLARSVALGDLAPDDPEVAALPADRRTQVLSLGYSFLRFRFLAKRVSREVSAPRSRAILGELSRVEEAGSVPDPPRPAVGAEQGHPIARFDFGGGVRDEEGFAELRFRPAFHSLLDPVGGYTSGAQIRIMEAALRWRPGQNDVRFEEWTVLDITSIAPRDRFLKPVSWSTGLGMRTRMLGHESDDDVDPRSVWYGEAGAGLAYELPGAVLGYGLARAVIEGGKGLDEDYALGPSVEAGLLSSQFDDRQRTHFYVRVFPVVLGDTTTSARAAIAQRFSLSDRSVLVLDLGVERGYGEVWMDAMISWRTYFRTPWGES
jgi:hypothetical protein